MREELETFLAAARERSTHGHGLPAFVERELRAYLDCGILARGFARARCRDCGFERLVPEPPEPTGPPQDAAPAPPVAPLTSTAGTAAPAPSAKPLPPLPRYRVPWAELLKKVFDLDVLACPECGGRLRIIAFIAQAEVAERILDHLGLASTGPPTAPARRLPEPVDPPPDYDPPDATLDT